MSSSGHDFGLDNLSKFLNKFRHFKIVSLNSSHAFGITCTCDCENCLYVCCSIRLRHPMCNSTLCPETACVLNTLSCTVYWKVYIADRRVKLYITRHRPCCFSCVFTDSLASRQNSPLPQSSFFKEMCICACGVPSPASPDAQYSVQVTMTTAGMTDRTGGGR